MLGAVVYHKMIVGPVILKYQRETASQTLSDMVTLEYMYQDDFVNALKYFEIKINTDFLILNRMQVFTEADKYVRNDANKISAIVRTINENYPDKRSVFKISNYNE